MLCPGSTQWEGLKKEKVKVIKGQNGVQAAYDTLLLRAHQAGFGCTAVFNTLNEANIHGLQLFFTIANWLVMLKHANTLR